MSMTVCNYFHQSSPLSSVCHQILSAYNKCILFERMILLFYKKIYIEICTILKSTPRHNDIHAKIDRPYL